MIEKSRSTQPLIQHLARPERYTRFADELHIFCDRRQRRHGVKATQAETPVNLLGNARRLTQVPHDLVNFVGLESRTLNRSAV